MTADTQVNLSFALTFGVPIALAWWELKRLGRGNWNPPRRTTSHPIRRRCPIRASGRKSASRFRTALFQSRSGNANSRNEPLSPARRPGC